MINMKSIDHLKKTKIALTKTYKKTISFSKKDHKKHKNTSTFGYILTIHLCISSTCDVPNLSLGGLETMRDILQQRFEAEVTGASWILTEEI